MTRSISAALSFGLVALLASPSSAAMYENSFHTMSAGTFGVAYIDGAGQVQISDGSSTPTPLALATSGSGISRVLAADLFGDGTDELVYVDNSALKRMYYYDFNTSTATLTTGSSVTDLSAGTFTSGDAFETVIVGTTGNGFRYDAPVASGGAGSFTNLGFAFDTITSGDFVTGNGIDEFAVVRPSNIAAVYTPGGTATDTGGSGFVRIVAGQLTGAATADIWLTNIGTSTFINIDPTSGAFASGGNGSQLAIGDVDGLGDKGFVIGGDSVIYQATVATPTSLSFTSGFAGNNNSWVDLILADLLHSDGLDEIYARRADGLLYRYDPASSSSFILIPEPSTIGLAGIGLLSLGIITYRRRKRS